jgi:hypothetical protein
MKLYIFTEETSAEKCFEAILPKIILDSQSFKILAHGGRENLKKALKTTLPKISESNGVRILITIDQDKHDCKNLKKELQEIIQKNCRCSYKIRIVCKELESWFLGDLEAISKAYPRFRADKYRNKSDMRNVDAINSPSKKLLKIITQLEGRKFLSKNELSEKISNHLDLTKNTSNSFNQTVQAIKFLFQKTDEK